MPLPMVHLAVAVEITGGLETGGANAAYLLGNLAPDAIHMRPDSTRDDKRRTHLRAEIDAQGPEAVWEYLRAQARDGALGALTLGYATHLLTDALWVEQVWVPMMRRLPGGLPRPERDALYYRETDEIDRLIYETAPWRSRVWQGLSSATPADVPGMVTAAEIALWRERTLHWFEHLAPASEPLRYLTLEQVLGFAGDAAARISGWLGVWGYDPASLLADAGTVRARGEAAQ